MKKLISLALVLLMTLGCIGTSFAAEVSPEGLTVNGWNGWTVKSGTAVTTQTNPLAGDTVSRGTVVKVTNGSAERYFAQWFEGVIELSVDVYGTGTISFMDSNNRSAGTLTLADASINSVACSYDADAWNTVKLFVATGAKETEVYIGDTYVTTIALTTLVRPTKLIVSSTSDIYIDNIVISELKKTNEYADNELKTFYEKADLVTFQKPEAKQTTRLNYELGQMKNFVFETELCADANDLQTSNLTLQVKNYTNEGNGDGTGVVLLGFSKSGYISMGADTISSKIVNPEPVFTLGEWFKIKVEVLTESQSVDAYIANIDQNGNYGSWVKLNKEPVRLYSGVDDVRNAEIYEAFERLLFDLNSSAGRTGLWYIKNAKISELADSKTETVLFEDFEDSSMNVTHVNLNDEYAAEGAAEATDYLILTPMMAPATPNGTTGTAGQLHRTANASSTIYVGEGTATTNGATSTGTIPRTRITVNSNVANAGNTNDEYYMSSLDLSDAESVTLSFDYYDAAIARKDGGLATVRDTLDIGFGSSVAGEKRNDIITEGVYMQNATVYAFVDKKSHGTKIKQGWDSVKYTLTPYSDSNTSNISYYTENNKTTSTWSNANITNVALKNLNELKFAIRVNNGGRYYIDNLKVTKEVSIGAGFIKESYSAYNTFTDNITRGNVTDIALRYVDFETADGKASGIPTAGGTVESITIEENATVKAGTKLVVGVFEGDTLSDSATIPVVDGTTTYPVGKTLTTTATSVVKVFIWDMNTLVPLTTAEQINDGTPRTKLVLLGDSIVCDYDENGELRGWGQMLGGFVNTNKLEILNYAESGATSSDYVGTSNRTATEARHAAYEEAIGLLDTGDYVMISLTTNDSGYLEAGGNINEDYQTANSFVANIWKMITDIKEKGATPILVTTHPRCYYRSLINRFSVESGLYQAMIRDMERIAKENEGVYLINLYEMAIDSYDTGNINSETGFDDTIRAGYVKADQTHLNETGATFAASLVAEGMAQLNCGIEDFVK